MHFCTNNPYKEVIMGIFGKNKEDEGPTVEIHSDTCTCEACMETETPHKEENMSEKAQTAGNGDEKGFVDEAIDFVENIPSNIGEYAGKVAWWLIKPLYNVHKHTTEPYIDEFMKAFKDGK